MLPPHLVTRGPNRKMRPIRNGWVLVAPVLDGACADTQGAVGPHYPRAPQSLAIKHTFADLLKHPTSRVRRFGINNPGWDDRTDLPKYLVSFAN